MKVKSFRLVKISPEAPWYHHLLARASLGLTSVAAQRAQTAEPLWSMWVFHEAAPILCSSQVLPVGTMLALGCGLLEVERFQLISVLFQRLLECKTLPEYFNKYKNLKQAQTCWLLPILLPFSIRACVVFFFFFLGVSRKSKAKDMTMRGRRKLCYP